MQDIKRKLTVVVPRHIHADFRVPLLVPVSEPKNLCRQQRRLSEYDDAALPERECETVRTTLSSFRSRTKHR